jgi:ABC-type dipeptide/oligopeptide/nickel transport system permease component
LIDCSGANSRLNFALSLRELFGVPVGLEICTVVQVVTLITAATYVLLILLADIAYVLINPRLRI